MSLFFISLHVIWVLNSQHPPSTFKSTLKSRRSTYKVANSHYTHYTLTYCNYCYATFEIPYPQRPYFTLFPSPLQCAFRHCFRFITAAHARL